MEEKNKPGETVPEPGESERISAERKAALQDIDRKREEKEKLRQDQKKQMKEAIIKEIRKEDSKQAKVVGKENLDPNGKKKRNRINNNKE